MPSAATGAADATIKATAIMSCFIFVSFEAGLSGGASRPAGFCVFNETKMADRAHFYQ